MPAQGLPEKVPARFLQLYLPIYRSPRSFSDLELGRPTKTLNLYKL